MTRRKTKRTKTQHLQRPMPNPNDPLGYREHDSRGKIDTRHSENDQEKPKQKQRQLENEEELRLETIGL